MKHFKDFINESQSKNEHIKNSKYKGNIGCK